MTNDEQWPELVWHSECGWECGHRGHTSQGCEHITKVTFAIRVIIGYIIHDMISYHITSSYHVVL